jgi:anti-sigma regulatory factor (Ser/Thr protein kinase)
VTQQRDGDGDVEVVRVDLRPGPHAPGEARRAARDVLRRWELPALVDRVVLVVSELVTNSVRYGRPPLRLDLHRLRTCVRVDVHDTVPAEPVVHGRTEVDVERESGRGLLIVSAVADEVGVEQVPGDGKHVYASFHTFGG